MFNPCSHTSVSPMRLNRAEVSLWPQIPEVIKGKWDEIAKLFIFRPSKGLIETWPSSRGHPVALFNSSGLSCLLCLLTLAQLGRQGLKCHSYCTAGFLLDFASLMNQGCTWLIEAIVFPVATQCTRKANYTNSTCRIHFVQTLWGVTESSEPWFMESLPHCVCGEGNFPPWPPWEQSLKSNSLFEIFLPQCSQA